MTARATEVPKTLERLVDLEAEAAFAGGILVDAAALHLVTPSDFFAGAHALVVEAAQRVDARGEHVETVTVRLELHRMGKLDAIGGDELLLSLTDTVPALARQPEIAYRLKELSQARAAHDGHLRAIAAYQRGDIEKARRLECEIAEQHGAPHRVRVRGLGEAAFELIQSWSAGPSNVCQFGIPPLDEFVGGLERGGSMFVWGAWQSTGKSYLLLTIALAQAIRGERPGIVSVEDPERMWAARALASKTRIGAGRLRRGDDLTGREKDKALQAAELLRKMGLEIAAPLAGDSEDVTAAMTELVRDRGCTVLSVDYLQAIDHGRGDYRTQVNRTLGDLKRCAGRLGVPLLLASQIARPDEGREWVEPSMRTLKESGDIENRAEGIGMLWRGSAPPEDGSFDTRPLNIRIAKVKGESVAGTKLQLERQPSGLWWDLDYVDPMPQRELFPRHDDAPHPAEAAE